MNVRDRILDYIRESTKARGYPPSVREIGKAVGLSSTSSVWQQIGQLESEGRLLVTAGVARSYRVRS